MATTAKSAPHTAEVHLTHEKTGEQRIERYTGTRVGASRWLGRMERKYGAEDRVEWIHATSFGPTA